MSNNKKYYFISDVHLGLQMPEIEKQKERKLVSFLQYCAKDAAELYIVGDLYDYWFEYRRVYQKGFFRTLTALQDLVESGVKVHYLIGNHDFMHRDFFPKEIGASLYEDAITVTLDGKRFFIAHGDGLVVNDMGYNILKKILRNKFLQWLYSFVHPDLGIWIASGTSKKSRDYTTKKDYGEEDGLFDAAKNKLNNGFDYVIMGHLHTRHHKKMGKGEYINLGSWLNSPCYGVYSQSKFEIVDWK